MFGRLLKHQLKSTWKEFVIAYALMIGASLIFSIVIHSQNDVISTIFGIIFVFSMIAVMFLVGYFSLKLFTSMYDKEAYINFTLPVSSHSMVISKILAVLIYSFGFVLSFIISILLMFLLIDPAIFSVIIEAIGDVAILLMSTNILIPIIGLLYGAITTVAGLVLFQLALAFFNSVNSLHRKKWLWFLIIYAGITIISIVLQFDPIGLYLCFDNNFALQFVSLQNVFAFTPVFSVWALIITIIELVAGYFLTIYLLDKKVEIKG